MLITDWRDVLTKAWSTWLQIIVMVLGALEYAVPYIIDYTGIPPKGRFWILVAIFCASFIAKFIPQKNMGDA